HTQRSYAEHDEQEAINSAAQKEALDLKLKPTANAGKHLATLPRSSISPQGLYDAGAAFRDRLEARRSPPPEHRTHCWAFWSARMTPAPDRCRCPPRRRR